MKFLISLFLILLANSAFASPRVCYVGKQPATERGLDNYVFLNHVNHYSSREWRAPRCENLRRISDASEVLQISLGISGVILTCTGAGIPATAVVGSAAVGLEILEFVIDHIPCEDVERDRQLQVQVRNLVCLELNNAGYSCEPER